MIIDSQLPIDAERGTRDFVEAVKATGSGRMLTPDDMARLLVWHTPRFAQYWQIKHVFNQEIKRLGATGMRVVGLTPRLFQVKLFPKGFSGLKEAPGSVLVELNAFGHAIGCEVLGTAQGPLSALYELSHAEPKAPGWLNRVSASWKRGPVAICRDDPPLIQAMHAMNAAHAKLAELDAAPTKRTKQPAAQVSRRRKVARKQPQPA